MANNVNNVNACAAAAAPRNTAMLGEIDEKLAASIASLATRNDVNQRLVAVVRNVMELIKSKSNEINLYAIAIGQIKALFERRHAIDKGRDDGKDFCNCLNEIEQIASLQNRVQLIHTQMQTCPKDQSSSAYRVHSLGIRIHFQNLRNFIASLILDNPNRRLLRNVRILSDFDRRLIGPHICWSLQEIPTDPSFEQLKKEMAEVQNAVGPLPDNAEALRKELTEAAFTGQSELLEKLIAGNNINIVELFSERAVGGEKKHFGGLFERTIFHYSSLPTLNEEHFRTLDVLVAAGSDIRECVSRDGSLLFSLAVAPKVSNLRFELRDKYRIGAMQDGGRVVFIAYIDSVCKLIRYLHSKGYKLQERLKEYRLPGEILFFGDESCYWSKYYLSRIAPTKIVDTLLELGLQFSKEHGFSLDHVKYLTQKRKASTEARLLIQEGAADSILSSEAEQKALVSEIRNPAHASAIQMTFAARGEEIMQLPYDVVSTELCQFTCPSDGVIRGYPRELADLMADYVVGKDPVSLRIWRRARAVFEQSNKAKEDADAQAASVVARLSSPPPDESAEDRERRLYRLERERLYQLEKQGVVLTETMHGHG